MSAYRLYDTWFRIIRKLLPAERITRVRNAVWMIIGLYLGQSVHLARIASRLPVGEAKLPSTTDRFRRFLRNAAFRVRPWYRPIAEHLLARAALSGTIRLILDGSKVGAGQQLLMVVLAYRQRALPICWTWVRGARGHSSARQQLALLGYVHSLLPSGTSVLVVGDCEFGAIPVARQIEHWKWQYVLRQKGNTQVSVSSSAIAWRDLASLVPERGQVVWYAHAIVTIKHLFHARLLGYWEPGEDEPWLLITNMDQPQAALRAYRRRMWVEEMFGDWKRHGVGLETTHLRHFLRLSRLVFLVAVLYLSLVDQGARAIKAGKRPLVDRADRRDLSIFRIGLYIVSRYLARNQRLTLHLAPYL
jgi:hypothetical protein